MPLEFTYPSPKTAPALPIGKASHKSARLELLDKQANMSIKPPLILTAALVLPSSMLETASRGHR
ncbi:hypothetical protein Acsp03_71720 [Actinomadura sp. NBRC 104412]|uniref:hypothetical protein n=1 Tax=Actinomadura sp. NBRC 104412 TaxID=3032203 RepID=UPI0024A50959|nr:hypothetical protein [Actinomadura sp. NBRC 104412]GLZ09706.1 hypothetical protein Acsp03_71720 [Actinomadura sp. NBRC 104412]